jgi:hypothetical protein
MKYNITQNDLVSDLYGEADYLQRMAIQSAESCDSNIRKAKANLKAAKDLLDEAALQPPDFVLRQVLNYSKRSALETEIN